MSAAGARERRARRRGPSLLSALVGAGLLIVAGFALGVVAGLVLEEPDLVLDYVTGRTRTVQLEQPAPGDVAARPPDAPPLPPPAETAPPAGGTAEPAARAAEPAAPESGLAGRAAAPAGRAAPAAGPVPGTSRPEGAAGAPASGFAVQVGAFADPAAAEALARRLRGQGFPVYLAPATGGDDARWRVRVGPVPTRQDAERFAQRLQREEKLGTWVLSEGAR